MMTTTTMLYARTSALPAIAAALALLSTPALAQEAQPAEPTPVATPEPAPAVEAAPVATDTSATIPTAPDSASKSTTRIATKRVTRTAAAKPAAVTTRAVSRTVTTHATTPVAPAAAIPPPAPAAAASQPKVTPVVDLNANPAPAAVAATAKPNKQDNTVPLAAGGALAALALGGAAIGLSRRRRADEERWVEDETVADEPLVTATGPMVREERPAFVAPSAFAWGNAQPAEQQARDDRLPGESWVERAYRGPTPGNPSVSLRNRLRRAAFFDKREREVAAGTAAPVETDAGLPDALTAAQREPEFA